MTVSEKLRLVQGLYSHAEMFGFHWDDGSDWTWHDVACKIADEIDAENAKLRETLKRRNRQFETMTDMWAARGAENARLRELAVGMYGMLEMFDKMLSNHDACETPRPLIFGEDKSFKDVMRELGVEVEE